MSHKKNKDIYYVMPTSKTAARQARIRFWILTIIVGIAVAGGMALLIYYKDKASWH